MKMTIVKAIKLLKIASEGWPTSNNERYYKALDLATEALKRVKDMRISPCTTADEILPGETE